MHSDARTLPDGTELDGDLCIIGAGAAGITIAREFANQSFDVILLESGGFDYTAPAQALYEGANTGLPYFPLNASRLRFFGGTTNHWGGWCGRLEPIDFEARDWVPESGWPISGDELDPYYRRAHPICDLGPYRYDTAYWQKQAENVVPFPFDAARVQTKIMQASAPTRFGEKYRDAITQAPNITLWTHANVTNIAATERGATVRRLRVQCLNGKTHRVRARCYVLACGGLENPRLLLNSNDVNPNGLGNDHDLVGRYFLEHPHVNSATLRLSKAWPMKLYEWNPVASKIFGLLSLSEEQQREHRVLNYTAALFAAPSPDADEAAPEEPPASSRATGLLELMNTFDAASDDEKVRILTQLGSILDDSAQEFVLSTRIEQCPNPNSRVMLSMETDALGQPRIELHWDLTALDKRTIRTANEVIGEEFGRLGLGRLRLMEWTRTEGDTWPDTLAGGWHHMGTTRMSTDPSQGVVDADCKVHSLDNLYVAGSSVYPTSGTANPTLTLVALALRLADHLKTRLKG